MADTYKVKESLMEDMEKDSKIHGLKDDDLESISTLCQKASDKLKEKEQKEQELKMLNEELNKLIFEVIPNALAEKNLTSLKLTDGSEINIEPYYSARITAENQSEAYKWLRDNGHGDLIKNEITVSFGRNEDEESIQLLKALVKEGHEPVQKTHVHPQTLKAFVREQIEAGKDLPRETFNAFAGERATIKPKGGK
jgi:hypothetical protein